MRFTAMMACLVLAALLRPAWGYPTLSGPTGFAVIPTAEITRPGFTLAGDWHSLTRGASVPFRGLLNIENVVEVGAMVDHYTDAADIDRAWNVNAKADVYCLFDGDIGVGALLQRERDHQCHEYRYNEAYAAWTRHYPPCEEDSPFRDITLNLGVNYTRVTLPDCRFIDAYRFFGGLRLDFVDCLQGMIEIQDNSRFFEETEPLVAMTVRYTFDPNAVAQAGLTNAEGLRSSKEYNWFGAIAVTFSSSSEEE